MYCCCLYIAVDKLCDKQLEFDTCEMETISETCSFVVKL